MKTNLLKHLIFSLQSLIQRHPLNFEHEFNLRVSECEKIKFKDFQFSDICHLRNSFKRNHIFASDMFKYTRVVPLRGLQVRLQSSAKSFTKSTLTMDDFALTRAHNIQLSSHNNLPLHMAITSRAEQKLASLITEEPHLALRLSVSSGGCHGFQYDLATTTDETFDPSKEETMFERGPAKVIADKETLEILRDSKIDYVKELIGESFKVVESPFTKSSCGCGSSFDVDFEKLEQASS